MSEDHHKYSAAGFPSSYWGKKAAKEAEAAKRAAEIERRSAEADELIYLESGQAILLHFDPQAPADTVYVAHPRYIIHE